MYYYMHYKCVCICIYLYIIDKSIYLSMERISSYQLLHGKLHESFHGIKQHLFYCAYDFVGPEVE